MFGMRISSIARALCELVELRKNSNTSYKNGEIEVNAITFSLDCRMNSYTDEADITHSQHIDIVICGNHAVFGALEKRNTQGQPIRVKTEDYEMITHHDTWTEALESYVSNVYFTLSKQVNEDRVAIGLPEIAPVAMSDFFWFALCGSPVKARANMVSIDRQDSYKKKLTLLTKGPNEWAAKPEYA